MENPLPVSSLPQFKSNKAVALLTLICILIIIAFVVTVIEKRRFNTFKEMRTITLDRADHLARGSAKNTDPTPQKECPSQALYDKALEKDSRSMSARELSQALDLHKDCGYRALERKQFSIDELEKDIIELRARGENLISPKAQTEAKNIVDTWVQIYTLEREQTSIYERLVDIQKEYWTSEYDKATGSTTSATREAKFGALNTEAHEKLAMSAEVTQHEKNLKMTEATFWQNLASHY